jgi:hypothetical protein
MKGNFAGDYIDVFLIFIYLFINQYLWKYTRLQYKIVLNLIEKL